MNPPTNQPFVGEEVYRRYLDGHEPLAERRHFCRLGRGRTAERTAAHPPSAQECPRSDRRAVTHRSHLA
jgi:hypothetical protein